ncbi:MAG: S-DNA-T family DNA segregation ATPase FtsK/SpoIIIE [Candidatus Poriferisodalaceae bacterium]
MEVRVRLNDPTATVADLGEALDLRDSDVAAVGSGQQGLTVDGSRVRAGARLTDIGFGVGSVISADASGSDDHGSADQSSSGEPATPDLMLEQVAGLDCGVTIPIPFGPTVVGRGNGADARLLDPAVSARHCRLDRGSDGRVRVADLDSRNGLRVGGRVVRNALLDIGDEVWIGSAIWRLVTRTSSSASPAQTAQVRLSGTAAHHRPPREAPAPPGEPVTIPDFATETPTRPEFSWVAVFAPLILAAVLVVVLGNVMFAIFALLGPVMALGAWGEGRSRARRKERRNATDRAAALASLRVDANIRASREATRRRAASPDVSSAALLCIQRGRSLWQRRLDHHDLGVLAIGVADQQWIAPSEGGARLDPVDRDLAASLETTLVDVPLVIPFEEVGVFGIVGRGDAARAVARGLLVEVLSLYGPADLDVVIADSDGSGDWAFASWAPHSAGHRVAARSDSGENDVAEWAAAIPRPDRERRRLVVIDGDELLMGRSSLARRLLGPLGRPVETGVWGVVIVDDRTLLPASCRAILTCDPVGGLDSGLSELVWLDHPGRLDLVLPSGVSVGRASDALRSIARLDDPESNQGGGLVGEVSLLSLLGGSVDAATIVKAWQDLPVDPAPRTPIGAGDVDVVEIDFRSEGPHALIGGTTGSGKSELLRSLVVGLATRLSPEHINFVLIDYKGGSAFDRCADLPHTVGMVTDLDGHLAERALVCLHAELEHRERVLRDHGASDLTHVRQLTQKPVLPRLMVMIDEFATMAHELPEFVQSLVGIAQRGRSLGVHLVLATQRPSGVISDDIRANTNLRIALRVQDRADSIDVIGTDAAAEISRRDPGRACLRFGPSEIVTVQTARCTGELNNGVRAPVELVVDAPVAATAGATRSELDALVEATAEAWQLLDGAPPRRPWPDALPSVWPLPASDVLSFAVADVPERQEREPYSWDLAAGNLLLIGALGSGVSSTLRAVACTASKPDGRHNSQVYALDLGANGLDGLAELPHVGSVIGSADGPGRRRLIRMFARELGRRRGGGTGADHPPMILLVDNVGVLTADGKDLPGLELLDELQRIVIEGPAFGLYCALGADRAGAVPAAWQSSISQTLLFDLADPMGHAMFGLRAADVPTFVPGRAVTFAGRELQVGWVDPNEIVAIAARASAAGVPQAESVPALEGAFGVDRLGPASFEGRPWRIPVGLRDDDLYPVGLELHTGEHILIAGPARSGRTNLLMCIAEQALAAGQRVLAANVAPSSTWPEGVLIVDDVASIAPIVGHRGVVMIDNAGDLEDPEGALASLATLPDVLLVVAANTSVLRSKFSHWTDVVARARTGVVLSPAGDLDGDVLGARLGITSTNLTHGAGVTPGVGVLVAAGAPTYIITPLHSGALGLGGGRS